MQPKRKFSWTNQKLFTRKEKQAPVSRRLLCNVSNWNSVPIMHGQSVETCWDNRPFLFTLPKGPGKPSRCRRSLKRGEPFRRPCAWQLCLLSRFRSGMCGSSFLQSAIQILRYLKLQACPNHPWPNMTKRILCSFFCSFVACAFMISLKAAKIPKTTGAESRKHRTSAPFFAVIPYSWPRVLSSSDYHTHRRMPIAFCVGEENDSLWFFHQVKPSKEAAAVLWDVTSSGQGLLHSPEFRRSLERGEPFRRPCAWQLCLLSRFRSAGMCGSSFFQSDIQILRYLKLQACPNHPWPNMTKRILCGFFCSFVACAFMISLKAAKIPKTTGAESRKHRTSAPFFAVIPYSWPRVLSSSDIFRLSHA